MYNHLISQRNLALDCTFTFTPLMNMATSISDIGGKRGSYTFKVLCLEAEVCVSAAHMWLWLCSWLHRLKAVLKVLWQSLHMYCLLNMRAESDGAW